MGLLGYLPQLAFFNGSDPVPVGSSHPNIVPYNSYAASDGAVLIACLTPDFFGKLCEALGIAEWGSRADLQTMEGRRDARAEVDGMIGGVVAKHSVAEMVEILERYDVPHAPILSVTQALEHPHSVARGMVETVTHPLAGELKLVGRPIKFVGSEPPPLERPPMYGEHSREILTEAGFDAAQIDKLEALGVLTSREQT